jgi:hypothetical protein
MRGPVKGKIGKMDSEIDLSTMLEMTFFSKDHSKSGGYQIVEMTVLYACDCNSAGLS